MAVSESNMIEFKMVAIIKLSQNESVKVFFFLQMVGTNLGKCEWVWESESEWTESVSELNLREENKVSKFKMVEFKMAAIMK